MGFQEEYSLRRVSASGENKWREMRKGVAQSQERWGADDVLYPTKGFILIANEKGGPLLGGPRGKRKEVKEKRKKSRKEREG